MNAHLPAKNRISRTEAKAVREYIQRDSVNLSRRYFKLAAIALNQLYGFGNERINAFWQRIGQLSADHDNDPIFWEHVDGRLRQLKLDLPPENYEEMEARRKYQ